MGVFSVLKDEIESVNKEVAQKEKNCRKLEREKEHLNHDRYVYIHVL